MPTNRTSNDIGFVPPTQYPIPPTRKAKQPPPKPWPLPAFTPLRAEDYDSCSTLNLPPYINPHDAFAIFKLFFTDEILDKLVEWTNKYAELYPAEGTEQLHRPRAWLPTCKECIEAGRKSNRVIKSRRKALSELSTNTTKKRRDSKEWKRPQRAPRTQYGYGVCQIPFYRGDKCWLPHLERFNSAD
jgi:hypothetical protein